VNLIIVGLYVVVGLVVGLILAIIGGSVNISKGRSYGEGFVLGLFLGIIGLIIVAILPNNTTVLEQSKLVDGSGRKCPYCAEIIKPEAVVCRYCGKELPTLKSISQELQKFAVETKAKPTEIEDGEIPNWKSGFSKIGWLEDLGENTKDALLKTQEGSSILREDFLCVTYADVKGSRITGLLFNHLNMFSNFTALIATPQKLIFVQPLNDIVNIIEYKNISKIDFGIEENSKYFTIHSRFGDTAKIKVTFNNSEDELIVHLFLERISSVR